MTVPVYATLTPGQARYILRTPAPGSRCLDRSSSRKCSGSGIELPSLEAIVTFAADAVPSPSVLRVGRVGARGHTRLMGGVGRGRQFRDQTREIRPGQLATIIYTPAPPASPRA